MNKEKKYQGINRQTFTIEVRRKISKSNKGRKFSKETRKKISLAKVERVINILANIYRKVIRKKCQKA